ncbi:hypothetical protein STCU_06394 [Strigomonas culicis]|uniref:Uncharacterized protein n=1 Tax=Strigomonas culicis TaxID=28005 RepID=S9UAH1_9TRYP|nr:hypothetical protein STCU_06394 [Strigomonas culicis]|eukprot:EPY25953.1 hypothetical protein STCU_06394 [Strigomonas culicis]
MDSNYREPTGNATPTCLAILSVPPKAVMRKKGYDPAEVMRYNGSEAHPLAKWTTRGLPNGSTYKMAVSELEKANSERWGLLRARLNFTDGRFELYARANPEDRDSFALVKTYDPNEVFHNEALERTQQGRSDLAPRLKHTANDRGHQFVKDRPSSFAPEVMYKDCPPPVESQAGYAFMPMSYNAYLVKPKDEPQGARKTLSNFMQNSTDYRPRSYRREGEEDNRHCHCAEVYQVGDYTLDLARQTDTVDHRNYRTVKNFTATGDLKANSSIVGKRNVKKPQLMSSTSGAAVTDREVPNA